MEFIPWRQQNIDATALTNDGTVPDFFASLLGARGFASLAEARSFASGKPVLHDPLLMADMDKAVQRIRHALDEGERILVYGDYDCDGVTSTVMLYDYLENAGSDVLYYIPQREGEGYGLNLAAVSMIRDAGVSLVITVDNGISSIEEIALATEYGIDVIVTDHHQPREQLPACVAVVDPHRADCSYPFKGLCGAGVVFKLLSALEHDTEGLLLELYGDLLAIATMADIVPLVDENRAIVRTGIETLRSTERVGLLALARAAGIELSTITGEQIGFGIAPRINVTGRIASVDLAVELLLTQDEEEATSLAEKINSLNQQRKDIEADIVADIGKLVTEQPLMTASRVLVVCGNGWHAGVIGITAARLVERYRKPCIILTRMASGELRGSARSVEGYSIIEAISACGEHLTKYGGHPMAAGLSLAGDKLGDFVAALEGYSAEHYPDMPCHCQSVDTTIDIADITLDNIALLDSLQPYGCCNPQPIPVLSGVTVRSITPIGGGNHIRLSLASGKGTIDAVYFGMTAEAFPLPTGTLVDCAVALSVNVWQGTSRPSVRVVSMVPCGFPMESKLLGQAQYDRLCRGETIAQELAPTCSFGREDLSTAFRLLRECSPWHGGSDWLLQRLGSEYGGFRLLVSLAVLAELGLISAVRDRSGMVYTVLPSGSKANIADAPTYSRLAAMGLTR